MTLDTRLPTSAYPETVRILGTLDDFRLLHDGLDTYINDSFLEQARGHDTLYDAGQLDGADNWWVNTSTRRLTTREYYRDFPLDIADMAVRGISIAHHLLARARSAEGVVTSESSDRISALARAMAELEPLRTYIEANPLTLPGRE